MANLSEILPTQLSETVETGPSGTVENAPHVSRLLGMVGLFLFTIGTASIIAAAHERGPIGAGYGLLAATLGAAGLFLHSLVDRDFEIRRLYGAFAALLMLAGLGFGILPLGGTKEFGGLFLPWGATLSGLSLLFLIGFFRNEDDEKPKEVVGKAVFGGGAAAFAYALFLGFTRTDMSDGNVLALAFLGFIAITLFLATTDTSDGFGYKVALGLGIAGAVLIAVALGRSIAPTVLHDGPAALKNASASIDKWKMTARLGAIALSLGVAALFFLKTYPIWLRTVAAVFGISLAGVFVVGSLTKVIINTPAPFLVPNGFVIAFLGLLALLISLLILAENQFFALTRRELMSFFYSPVAYFVLFGAVFGLGLGYIWFSMGFISYTDTLGQLRSPEARPEPVIQRYEPMGIISAFLVTLFVPALTMRLFAEERKSQTLEMLLTAPVHDAWIVLSKFFAAWLFLVLCWLPAGLMLIGLRYEAGNAMDYRPLFAYYIAFGCMAMTMISFGLLISSLTQNQIVSAVITGTLIFGMILSVVFGQFQLVPEGLKAILSKFDLLTTWGSALQGQLSVQVMVFHVSLTVFFLFLTTKVLDIRKWS
ncbi:MAG: ABC transporter permease [Fimbriiglobus sp.]